MKFYVVVQNIFQCIYKVIIIKVSKRYMKELLIRIAPNFNVIFWKKVVGYGMKNKKFKILASNEDERIFV